MPGVKLVEGYREYAADTDVGPGAHWCPAGLGRYGRPSGAPAVQGEGILVGMIDSGINFGSPSFAAVSPADGYTHVNPLGEGVYLGTCAAGQVDAGRCNSKLIGGFDFVCGAPGNQCGLDEAREEPGFGDSNGHGSHTASIAAGNRRDVLYQGISLRISGVAPRANLVVYDACHTDVLSQFSQSLCPNVSTVAAVNQAISDGVDVLNFSAGGGVFALERSHVTCLPGGYRGRHLRVNLGRQRRPDRQHPGTSGTLGVDYRGGPAWPLRLWQTDGSERPVTRAGSPAGVCAANVPRGVPLAASIPGTTPLRISPDVNMPDVGCDQMTYPAGSFTGAIVVVRRRYCNLSLRIRNAITAGATAVIVANDRRETIRRPASASRCRSSA